MPKAKKSLTPRIEFPSELIPFTYAQTRRAIRLTPFEQTSEGQRKRKADAIVEDRKESWKKTRTRMHKLLF
jgi:hypothetical protein